MKDQKECITKQVHIHSQLKEKMKRNKCITKQVHIHFQLKEKMKGNNVASDKHGGVIISAIRDPC